MITYTIVTVLIATFAAVGISAFIKEKRHKRKQIRIAKAYERFTSQFKLAIEYSEFLCYRYIGLDRKNRKLILIDHCGDEKREDCISLYEIGETKIIHAKDEFHNTRAIMLELRTKRNDEPVCFYFYNKDYDPLAALASLSRKAVHWKTRVDIHKQRGNVSFEAGYVL